MKKEKHRSLDIHGTWESRDHGKAPIIQSEIAAFKDLLLAGDTILLPVEIMKYTSDNIQRGRMTRNGFGNDILPVKVVAKFPHVVQLAYTSYGRTLIMTPCYTKLLTDLIAFYGRGSYAKGLIGRRM